MNRLHLEKRFFEIIPGALVWMTLIASVVFSFVRPLWVVYFVIVFDLYWLFRVTYFIPFLLLSWYRFHRDTRKNWQPLASALPGYEPLRHVIFLPTVKEDISVIRETLNSLLASAYPADRMIVVLAGEERAGEEFAVRAQMLKQEYESRFMRFIVTTHPKDLPDEIVGKGSNLNWSGYQVFPMIDAMGLRHENVIVSSFDVDTIVHPQYFSHLTYLYATIPDPTRSSFQPVALYNNNLWESPAAVRVAMFGTTFWLLTELARPENAMTFSSHSMSLKMLVDVGFWQKDIVSEDSRIFLQALIRYHGAYRVTPMHIPVSMDTVMTGQYWLALGALYKQIRRWAWGVENFPFMAMEFRRDKQMPWLVKAGFLWKQIEGTYTWATAPMLIFLLGRLPFWVAPERFREFAVFQNTPFTLQWLMRFAMVGVFVSAALALTLLPRRPAHVPRHEIFFVGLLQWLLLPVTFIVFGAFPAIDAQTRMMLGRSLGFNVSPKRKAVEGHQVKT